MSEILWVLLVILSIIIIYGIGWKESKKVTRIEFLGELRRLLAKHQNKALRDGKHDKDCFCHAIVIYLRELGNSAN